MGDVLFTPFEGPRRFHGLVISHVDLDVQRRRDGDGCGIKCLLTMKHGSSMSEPVHHELGLFPHRQPRETGRDDRCFFFRKHDINVPNESMTMPSFEGVDEHRCAVAVRRVDTGPVEVKPRGHHNACIETVHGRGNVTFVKDH